MQNESFTVKNVKCGGCAANIKKGLAAVPGVGQVDVAVETGRVTVSGDGISRSEIAARLTELGYPETP